MESLSIHWIKRGLPIGQTICWYPHKQYFHKQTEVSYTFITVHQLLNNWAMVLYFSDSMLKNLISIAKQFLFYQKDKLMYFLIYFLSIASFTRKKTICHWLDSLLMIYPSLLSVEICISVYASFFRCCWVVLPRRPSRPWVAWGCSPWPHSMLWWPRGNPWLSQTSTGGGSTREGCSPPEGTGHSGTTGKLSITTVQILSKSPPHPSITTVQFLSQSDRERLMEQWY